MALGELPDGKKPSVQNFKGKVAIWAGDTKDPMGVLISADAAIDTGLACLQLAAELQGRPVRIETSSIEFETADNPTEEVAARIIVTAQGAPLAIEVGAHQFVELAAAIAVIAREIG